MDDNFYWIDDLQQLIDMYQLQQFAQLLPGQMDDGFYVTGHQMWLACTAPPQPIPEKTHYLARFHCQRKSDFTLYQLPFMATDGVWIHRDMAGTCPDYLPVTNIQPIGSGWEPIDRFD